MGDGLGGDGSIKCPLHNLFARLAVILAGSPPFVFCANLVGGLNRGYADFRERQVFAELRDCIRCSTPCPCFPFVRSSSPASHGRRKLVSGLLDSCFNLFALVPRLWGFVDVTPRWY